MGPRWASPRPPWRVSPVCQDSSGCERGCMMQAMLPKFANDPQYLHARLLSALKVRMIIARLRLSEREEPAPAGYCGTLFTSAPPAPGATRTGMGVGPHMAWRLHSQMAVYMQSRQWRTQRTSSQVDREAGAFKVQSTGGRWECRTGHVGSGMYTPKFSIPLVGSSADFTPYTSPHRATMLYMGRMRPSAHERAGVDMKGFMPTNTVGGPPLMGTKF
jgi:hypothetical protein